MQCKSNRIVDNCIAKAKNIYWTTTDTNPKLKALGHICSVVHLDEILDISSKSKNIYITIRIEVLSLGVLVPILLAVQVLGDGPFQPPPLHLEH